MLTETVPNGGSLSAMNPLTNWQQPYVTLNAVAISPATDRFFEEPGRDHLREDRRVI